MTILVAAVKTCKAGPQVFANGLRRRAERLLARADIRINGDRPWDIVVHRQEFFGRVLRQGSLGLGESYMDGWWDSPALDQFFDHLFRSHLEEVERFPRWGAFRLYLRSLLLNPQSKSRSFRVGEGHYDLGNDLFRAMLDQRMVYTCGYWDEATDLGSAQQTKLEFVCRAIGARPSMRILDIGCGWGSFAKYAAEKYCAKVLGVTVSREQAKLAEERCCGLPVEIRLQDYRELRDQLGKFDCVVSLGMFEHVGHKNYRRFMEIVRDAMAGCGRFYLSCIGKNVSVRTTDPWIEKYIFPNSMLPSLQQIGEAAEGLLVMEDLQNWASHYDRTLMAWHQNFKEHWNELRAHYDERFFRMWEFYLMASAGSFRSHRLQVWQMLFSPEGAGGC